MQEKTIKLKEIIWEITEKCKNHCSYCGSKDGWNKEINLDVIKTITNRIVEFGEKLEINISGGDPLLIPLETHTYIVESFKKIEISPKIIINPKSFRLENSDEKYKILELYDWNGISINEQAEIDYFNEHLLSNVLTHKKTTIITNFNIKNVFLFNTIEKLVKKLNANWQIQYTMYNKNDTLALYDNDEANKYFYSCIENSIKSGTKIILADNINNGKCSAGLASIGILANGDVVPCLSMRSWVDDISNMVQGNLINNSLYDIWTTKFISYRFNTFKCCKDHCGNKCYMNIINIINTPIVFIEKENIPNEPYIPPTGIQMYAVKNTGTYVYAVQKEYDRTILYAVF